MSQCAHAARPAYPSLAPSSLSFCGCGDEPQITILSHLLRLLQAKAKYQITGLPTSLCVPRKQKRATAVHRVHNSYCQVQRRELDSPQPGLSGKGSQGRALRYPRRLARACRPGQPRPAVKTDFAFKRYPFELAPSPTRPLQTAQLMPRSRQHHRTRAEKCFGHASLEGNLSVPG